MRVSVTRLLAASSLVLGIAACGPQDRAGAASALRESGVAGPSSTGTDFWLMFPSQAEAFSTLEPTIEVLLVGDVATDGVVEVPGLAFAKGFSIVPGATTAVVLPSGARMKGSDVVEKKAIRVTAGAPIAVVGFNLVQFTSGAFLGLPVELLGTEYLVLAYPAQTVGATSTGSELGITATADGTIVTITPSVTTDSHPAGVPYTVTLDRGEAYQLANSKAGADLSGTQIAATSPVAVFGGQHCAWIPAGVIACDHVVEQLPPTRAWGTRFVSMPFATRLGGDTFRFLASVDGTTIAIDGKTVATLARGAVHEQLVDGPAEIVASAPLLVAQYANGEAYDKKPGDPSMTIVPPVEQFLASYDVAIPPDRFASYVNVVAPAVVVGAVELDGIPVPEHAFTPIGTSGFSGARLAVKPGAHRLTGSLPFGAVAYGFAEYEAYAYPAGMGGASLDAFASLVTGGGFLGSGVDRASFGFVARHAKGALSEASHTEIHLKAPGLRFESDPDGSLLVLGARAHLFATGRVDGEPGYRIALTAIDGGLGPTRDADRARIQIFGPKGTLYDSSEGSKDLDAWLTAPLGGGSVVIHR